MYGLYFQEEHYQAQVTSLLQRQGKHLFSDSFSKRCHFIFFIKKQVMIVKEFIVIKYPINR